MGIETITLYKTDDGTRYESLDLAKKHQSELDFIKWYQNNWLSGNITTSRIRDWLLKHEKAIIAFYRDQGLLNIEPPLSPER